MTFFNTSFETMKVKMDNLEKETKTKAQQNDRLKSDSAKMTTEGSDLRSAIDNQAQYTRRECLEIRGVPVTSGEDTNEIVKKIGTLIDVDINDRDISVSHRIPSANSGESGSTPIRYPAIVVKFTNRRIRDRFYKARPKLKCYNIIDIGLGRHGESNIFIQESLKGAKRKLLKNCLQFHKDQNFKYILTYYGVIYLRRKEHTPASRITSVGDLEGLQPRRSTSESTSTATTEVSAQPS